MNFECKGQSDTLITRPPYRRQSDTGPSMMPGISNESQLPSFNVSRALCPGWSPNRKGTRMTGRLSRRHC
ncbi:hypothetical protein UPYG_G00276660 [Umbra pygmaea]|uniref:Uncharacterized protein n=1 Tax=Umbra pygmaea TaxID=75934 RepID=A0ABD0W718_UMBPY